MSRSLLVGALLLMPFVASADGRAAAPACKGSQGYADAFDGRRTFFWRPDWLAATKARGASDPAQADAWKHLFARADQALAGPTYSVVDKTRVPPSGDKHDYMSMGPYWWPDPNRPNGEPYLRRDGEVNPERNGDAFDATRMDRMGSAVEALSLAYYFSDDRRYANKAAELVRIWFLQPATRMNPNLEFAQGVPGRTPGRGAGVLDTLRLTRVIEQVPSQRLAKQIEADGKMPRELERTRAYHYTIYALRAAASLADLAGCVNVDLWRGPGAPRLKAALDFIVPYVGRERDFPHPDLKPGPDEGSLELFSRAAWAYGDMEYRRAAKVLAEYNPSSRIHLMMARP